MTTCYLVEITGADAAGALTVFRYATQGYTSQPADTPASTHYEGRVIQPGLMARNMHGDRRTFGPPDVGYGLIELNNADGGLDTLLSYGFDGQTCKVRRGDSEAAYSAFTTVFQGTMDQLSIGMERLTVRMRDGLQNLTIPVQPLKYAGDNTLPDGVAGVAEDLKGKPYPICWGYVYNATPPCVNTSRLIYQIHRANYGGAITNDATNGINRALAVYDKRVALAQGAEKTYAQIIAAAATLTFTVTSLPNDELTTSAHGYTTGDGVSVAVTGGTLAAPLSNSATYYARVVSATVVTLHPTKADALANTNRINITDVGSGTQSISNNRPAAGNFDYCYDTTGVFFRLGSTPAGAITFDAVHPSCNSDAVKATAPGEIAYLLARGGMASTPTMGNSEPSFIRSAGIYISEERDLLGAMDEVLAANGLFLMYVVTDNGYITLYYSGQLGTSAVPGKAQTITEAQIVDIERVTLADANEGIPVWRVNLGYRKNYTPMVDADLASAVTQADRAWLVNEWRAVSAEDSNVKLQYPNARELNRNSLFTSSTHAATEASRLLTQYKARRDCFVVTIHASLAQTMDINDYVTLTHARFGLSAGVLFYVIGVQPNFADETVTLTLWK
jgi:hypothetical protein